MKRFISFILGLIIIILINGCVSPRLKWVSSPVLQNNMPNNYFKTLIKPVLQIPDWINGPCFTGGFELSIENKTKHNIEVVWDKTLYIYNGATNGGFMFNGIIYKDRHNSKPSDIVFANSFFKKIIYPNNLVNFRHDSWTHERLGKGEHGIYLTVKVGREIICEKLTVNIDLTETNELH